MRFHCYSTSTGPLCGLNCEVLLYLNWSHRWSCMTVAKGTMLHLEMDAWRWDDISSELHKYISMHGWGRVYCTNKPVQGLRLADYIAGFTPNQPKIDRSLYHLRDQSSILMATSDYLPVIQNHQKGNHRQLFSLSFELISVVHPVHQLDDCPHLTILTHK